MWLSTSAAVDILVAISMTYFLLKRRTNFQQSRVLISHLIRLTVETGSLTAIVAIVDTTLFNTTKGTNFHSCLAIVLAKLYTNTLLVVLNNRIYMQRDKVPERLAGNPSISTSSDRDFSRNRFREVLAQRDRATTTENNPTLSKGQVYEDIAIDTLPTKNLKEISTTLSHEGELGRPSGPINIWIDREETTCEM